MNAWMASGYQEPYNISTIALSEHRKSGKESMVPVVHVLSCNSNGVLESVKSNKRYSIEDQFHYFIGDEIKRYRSLPDKTWDQTSNGVIVSPFQHIFMVDRKNAIVVVAVFTPTGHNCTFFVTMQKIEDQSEVVVYVTHSPGETCLTESDYRKFEVTMDQLVSEALERMSKYIPKPLRKMASLVDTFTKSLKRGHGKYKGRRYK